MVIIILGGTDNGWGGYGFFLFFLLMPHNTLLLYGSWTNEVMFILYLARYFVFSYSVGTDQSWEERKNLRAHLLETRALFLIRR